MVSFRTTLLALASAIVVSADYYIDPATVSLSTRTWWCQNQKSTCPSICRQTTPDEPLENECDPEGLTYSCLCSDNKRPNVAEFSLTLPYFTCTEWGQQCVKGCGTNECSAACLQEHPCGAQKPTRINVTTTASMPASKTAGPTDEVANGLDGGDGEDDFGGKSAAGALRFGDSFGLAVVAGGLIAGFAVLL